MKKAISLLFLAVLLRCSIVYAQNYSCIDTSQTRFYLSNNTYHEVKAIRIDSIKNMGSYTFYKNFPTVRSIQSSQCLDINGPSWIGPGMIKMNDFNIFLNQTNDSIKIKTDALPWQRF